MKPTKIEMIDELIIVLSYSTLSSCRNETLKELLKCEYVIILVKYKLFLIYLTKNCDTILKTLLAILSYVHVLDG